MTFALCFGNRGFMPGKFTQRFKDGTADTFALHPGQTAFLTNKREHEWKIEKGDFTVMIGAPADDIRLTGSFRITEDRIIAGKGRKFYTLGKS